MKMKTIRSCKILINLASRTAVLLILPSLITSACSESAVKDKDASQIGAVQNAMCADAKPLVSIGVDERLVYTPDRRGNRIPDFSRAGYMGGGVSIPDLPLRDVLEPVQDGSDDTARIQAAIDKLSSHSSGLRGTLLLKRGVYRISGTLKIETSGVVLRGEGQGKNGTTLLATGKVKRDLIVVRGKPVIVQSEGSRREITDDYVPWGATSFSLESTEGLSVGDSVIVFRPSTEAWIHDIKMDQIVERRNTMQWSDDISQYNFYFERTITDIKGKQITLDAPIVNAMEDKYGGGFVYQYLEEGRITQVGIEHLRLVSEYQKGKENKDEDHAWRAVSMDHVENAWIRNVTNLHFSHAITLGHGTRFVTAQDCASLKPVSKICGGRRYPYSINGQCCLIQRCYSDNFRHAAATSGKVRGPNVFLDCLAENTHADTGPHHRWAMGILWDNLKGGEFKAQDRGKWGTGHGWAGAQQVFWNCETTSICVQKPPTAQNYAIGCTGKIVKGMLSDRSPGHYESHGKHVRPRSLYLKQLEDRLGTRALENVTTEAQRNGTIYHLLKETLSQ